MADSGAVTLEVSLSDQAMVEPDHAADVDLDSDPFADDLGDKLAVRAPQRYVTRTTIALGSVALLVVGFLVGAQIQKRYGTSSGAGGAASGARSFARSGAMPSGMAFPGGGLPGGSGASAAPGVGREGAASGLTGGGSGATTGTVKLVDGTTVYLQTSDGQTVTVHTSSSTTVQAATKAALSDLAAGAQVSVEGTPDGSGVITANKITKG